MRLESNDEAIMVETLGGYFHDGGGLRAWRHISWREIAHIKYDYVEVKRCTDAQHGPIPASQGRYNDFHMSRQGKLSGRGYISCYRALLVGGSST